MIARKYRFHGHNSLRATYQRAQTVRSSQLSLKYASNPRRTHYRAAVVISRKVNKSAVVRNRLRRRIYAVIEAREPQLQSPYDLIITVFSDQLTQLTADELESLLDDQLKKAGILSLAGDKPTGHGIVEARKS